ASVHAQQNTTNPADQKNDCARIENRRSIATGYANRPSSEPRFDNAYSQYTGYVLPTACSRAAPARANQFCTMGAVAASRMYGRPTVVLNSSRIRPTGWLASVGFHVGDGMIGSVATAISNRTTCTLACVASPRRLVRCA